MSNKFIYRVASFNFLLLITGFISSYSNLGALSVLISVFLPVIFILNGGFSVYYLLKKRYWFLIGSALFIFKFPSFYQLNSSNDTKIDTSISILSYNVRQFNHDHDIHKEGIDKEIADKIARISPDILAIQESAFKKSLNIKGYKYRFLGYRENVRKSLLVTYSKYPIVASGYIDFPNTLNNAIYTDIKVNKDTIRVYNTHLQSFKVDFHNDITATNKLTSYFKSVNKGHKKQIEQADLVKNHSKSSNKKIIICGDFNATQYSLPYKILSKNLKDSFLKRGSGMGTTYKLLEYPLRLDYFLVDNNVKIINHKNFNLKLSDHEPVLLNFSL